jgi:hypothetical protein
MFTRILLVGLATLWSIAVAPNVLCGEILSVSWDDSNSPVHTIDTTTGGSRLVGLSGYSRLNSLARNNAGVIYSAGGSSDATLVRINPNTGGGTIVATLNVSDIRGLTFSPNDTLYAVVKSGASDKLTAPDLLYTINVVSGAATLVGNTGMPGLQDIAFSSTGTLYGWDVGSGSGYGLGLVMINPVTAAVTDVNPNVGGSGFDIQGISFAPDGTLYGAGSSLFKVDTTTGVSTFLGSGGYYDVRGICALNVPEPCTRSLLGMMGAVGLLAYVWRRRSGERKGAEA